MTAVLDDELLVDKRGFRKKQKAKPEIIVLADGEGFVKKTNFGKNILVEKDG